MKFDFVIGNPPYQESKTTNNKSEAIYPFFYDAAIKIAEKSLLITPARFLFNAGLTPKAWNQKMLSSKHVKVMSYFNDSAAVFPNTNINGGVAIVYQDKRRSFDPIENFIPNDTLRKIASRFSKDKQKNMSSIMFGGRSDLKFNDKFLEDFPNTKSHILKILQEEHPDIKGLGPNEEYEIKSSSFERTPYAFVDSVSDESNYYKILGIEAGKRVWKWVKKDYLALRYPERNNVNRFKVFIAKADGAAGTIGKPIPARILGKSVIAGPGSSSIPSFISIGSFDTEEEARNASKYLKTKFARTLFGILKVTQDVTPAKWAYVPIQDFTNKSDIPWESSVSEIDEKLYKKYKLSDEEVAFIESHVADIE